MRVGSAHAIDFLTLTRRQFLLWIKTPASFEQALTPQNLMDARNASPKIMRRIEDGRVCICDLLGERQQFAWNLVKMTLREREVKNSGLRPYRPMPEQAADDPDR